MLLVHEFSHCSCFRCSLPVGARCYRKADCNFSCAFPTCHRVGRRFCSWRLPAYQALALHLIRQKLTYGVHRSSYLPSPAEMANEKQVRIESFGNSRVWEGTQVPTPATALRLLSVATLLLNCRLSTVSRLLLIFTTCHSFVHHLRLPLHRCLHITHLHSLHMNDR